jgi:carboxyl-terminal processing protease
MEGIGIPPHHQVSQTVADFMKDEDTVLNYAVGLITEKQ